MVGCEEVGSMGGGDVMNFPPAVLPDMIGDLLEAGDAGTGLVIDLEIY